jgi:hypothetical protein
LDESGIDKPPYTCEPYPDGDIDGLTCFSDQTIPFSCAATLWYWLTNIGIGFNPLGIPFPSALTVAISISLVIVIGFPVAKLSFISKNLSATSGDFHSKFESLSV